MVYYVTRITASPTFFSLLLTTCCVGSTQTPANLNTIVALFTMAPGICYLLCALTAKVFFKLTTEK
ncbi:hypothetical protein [unidentified bacterial endosymbiont]|jgi:Na+/melibiose symporter-like transporter|uniref:hypothetical protein n=1 Tax=unidentified bacterial endosymbiont TaxID=2355 RepID=UPI00209FD4F8|nr:hypothetical protein [unidentified bacterial endosymbiont]